MSSVPAVIAKASAIHNPIIYAITHPKYRCGLLQASKPTSGMEGLSLQRKAEVICLPLISCMCVSWGGGGSRVSWCSQQHWEGSAVGTPPLLSRILQGRKPVLTTELCHKAARVGY